MKIFDFFRFKVLAGKTQRVRKNTTLSLLAVQQLLMPLLARALFLDCTVYIAFLFKDMHFGKRTLKTVKLLESNVLICCLKITRQQISVK